MAIDDNASYELTGYQVKDLAQKIRAKADSASLASVATSGLYSDLVGAPTIPTVYNGTLTIQQNGTTVGTFTANQSTDTTINLTSDDSSYSTSEVKTAGTWIDGKPIYKKTINFGALPNATSKSIAHGISSIDWVINVESVAKRSDGTFCPAPLVPPGSGASTRYGFFEIDATNIVFYTGYNYSNMTAYVTLWYTKTTD